MLLHDAAAAVAHATDAAVYPATTGLDLQTANELQKNVSSKECNQCSSSSSTLLGWTTKLPWCAVCRSLHIIISYSRKAPQELLPDMQSLSTGTNLLLLLHWADFTRHATKHVQTVLWLLAALSAPAQPAHKSRLLQPTPNWKDNPTFSPIINPASL